MPAIAVKNLSKEYVIGGREAASENFREMLTRSLSSPFRSLRRLGGRAEAGECFWALKDVGFELAEGDAVGIIGRNGAGKSTLLKILSRITAPTTGRVELRGRVSSLLEVGTGFHPELTGRENIFLNGAILGMRKAEIRRKFDEIVAFSGVERFLDTPVKRYSSGMSVRLAFAVAAHLEPEILIVDEVLAVGDAQFQRKCLGKMGDVAKEGRTVLFVSHNMAAVEGLCRNAFQLEEGRVVRTGPSHEVVQAYLASLPMLAGQELEQRSDREGNGRFRFTRSEFRVSGMSAQALRCGQDAQIIVSYRGAGEPLRNVSISIPIFTTGGQCMLMLANHLVGVDFEQIPREGRFSVRIPRLPLSPGQYYLNLYGEVNGVLADWVKQAVLLTVEGGDFYGTGHLPPKSHGGFLLPHEWRVED
jgi:lipopolysaccharide transport system ATP-binding protein